VLTPLGFSLLRQLSDGAFHSGEDRRVKKAFKNGLRDGRYASISDEVIRPSAEEQRANPRSSAAKLRWAIRAAAAGG